MTSWLVFSSSAMGNYLQNALGHFLLIDHEHCDKLSIFRWNAILDVAEGRYSAFLDEVQCKKVVRNCPDELLFRLKMTHLVQGNEWIMVASWSHVIGDACVLPHTSTDRTITCT